MPLKPVLEYAYSLGFEEEPDYTKLKFLLKKILLDEEVVPHFKFDWSFDHPKIVDWSVASVIEVKRRFSPLEGSNKKDNEPKIVS